MSYAGRGRGALVLAGVLGSLHAAFSVYWGLGGEWLVETLGRRMVDAFAGWEWLLLPVGLALGVGLAQSRATTRVAVSARESGRGAAR